MTRKTAAAWEYQRQFGERIRRVRKDKRLTQFEAALRAEIARTVFVRYEHGELMPGALTVLKIARGLDVSPGWLLRGPREERPAAPEMICSTGATMGPEMLDPEFRNRPAKDDAETAAGVAERRDGQ